MYRLIITVKKIDGFCEAFEESDKLVYENSILKIQKTKTGGICLNAISSLFPYFHALERDFEKEPNEWLADGHEVQCPDPGAGHRGGAGTALFVIERERIV